MKQNRMLERQHFSFSEPVGETLVRTKIRSLYIPKYFSVVSSLFSSTNAKVLKLSAYIFLSVQFNGSLIPTDICSCHYSQF